MKYEDFESAMVAQNRKLWFILVGTLMAITLLLSMIYAKRSYFVFRGGDLFQTRPLEVDVCKFGVDEIINGTPNPFLIEEAIIKLLKDEPFLPSDEGEATVLAMKSAGENLCHAVIKTKKLRAFTIILKESSAYPFYYKISQIDEVEPKGDEL